MQHGYVFSMAVGTIEEWLKLVPFFVRGRTVDSEGGGGGGGGGFFIKKISAHTTHKKKNLGCAP